MSDRKLATIRTIESLELIPDADRIEVAVIGGWRVVVQKGLYKAGDKAVYLEIDSWVPHALAPFLTEPSHFPKVYEGVEGQRLKTKKLRGVISQGLLLPLDEVINYINYTTDVTFISIEEDFDLTEQLGILKWERPIPASMGGLVKGNFPSFIPKTDQERLQNLKTNFYGVDYYPLDDNKQNILDADGKPIHVLKPGWIKENSYWEISEKLDGTSCTFYLDDDNFGVCSRNLELKETEGNLYWNVTRSLDIEKNLRESGLGSIAIQGEIIGPGIQDNRYGLSTPQFFVFDMYDIINKRYISPGDRRIYSDKLGLTMVPHWFAFIQDVTPTRELDDFITYADGPSKLNPKTNREGVVFKRTSGDHASFKVISNKFLLKTGE